MYVKMYWLSPLKNSTLILHMSKTLKCGKKLITPLDSNAKNCIEDAFLLLRYFNEQYKYRKGRKMQKVEKHPVSGTGTKESTNVNLK